jgi:hypothetical protein
VRMEHAIFWSRSPVRVLRISVSVAIGTGKSNVRATWVPAHLARRYTSRGRAMIQLVRPEDAVTEVALFGVGYNLATYDRSSWHEARSV